ncbi:uncharacterized protein LOC111409876 [Olea europaea var. sylvestris]|uniref:PHD-type zinc finger plants domain-containing protein n=1 Tax=Olea europaea subsp. europaea TaxID=158383 RepID=A0A8S0PEL5_OLEEU|nr:uncharacterized protein LOC111409876 [Olea europaea var. sylvestris]CAA2945096.1 Hypothetical predicted protein [Olea europaea subsp. europaea]
MVDQQTVCCMCGDVGFPDKLFRCINCRNRFQHSYCSNYYRELADPIEVCDWCQSEGRNSKHGNSSSKSMRTDEVRSAYSSGKIKHDREERTEKVGKSPTSTPSPRTATRRYKLLKDVM